MPTPLRTPRTLHKIDCRCPRCSGPQMLGLPGHQRRPSRSAIGIALLFLTALTLGVRGILHL